jgi:hypothetical protein
MPLKGYPEGTALYPIAVRLFGLEWASWHEYTIEDLISALDTVMDIYYNVTGGENYLRPEA